MTFSYIQKRSPSGAHNVSLAIERTIELCALNPRGAAITDLPDIYGRSLAKYRYTVFYRMLVDIDAIEIVRVVHGARVRNLGRLPDDA